jgi:CDP-glucose 4,6-dehydratase
MINPSTYRNKKVFLTGHTGFKGAWMCMWLQMMKAKVKGYALKPEKISLYNKISSQLKIESVIADIRNKEKLKKEIVSFQPDYIFHFAAQAIVRESYINPVETFETNISGTVNVLDAVRSLKKKCVVVIVTTDKVYENLEMNIAYKESDKLGGYDPYSASKAAAEIVTESYRLSFFNPEKFTEHKKSIASARAGNVIGGGDYAVDRIIPDIYRALSAGKTINVRNPDSIRPWQHVLEPLSGYLQLAEAMNAEPEKFSAAFNFGPDLDNTYSVEELVNLALAKWGTGRYKNAEIKNAHHEAGILRLDISKAKSELGWRPKWNSNKTIERTIDWYKNSLNPKCDYPELCMKDINEYMNES